MDQPTSIQDQLEEIRDLTKENNKLIKAMKRDALIGGVLKTLIWVGLVGASLYYSMQYLEPLLNSFQAATGGMNAEDIGKLFEQYKAQMGQ